VSPLEVLVALAIAVGLLGIVVPVLPGFLLIVVAIWVWAFSVGGATAWTVTAVATVFLLIGTVVKYTVPGRRLKDAGVPASTQWVGVALGLVGFFVIPVVGLFVGFVLGIWLAELRRLGHPAAWPSTKHALKAAGLSVLIELAAGLLAAWTWAVGVALT
jgi:uncharacterized protein YqgC (DUF456 family)